MSNTESSAIARLIADAQGPVALDVRNAVQPGAARLARGTMLPSPGPRMVPAPAATPAPEPVVEIEMDALTTDPEELIEPDELLDDVPQPWPTATGEHIANPSPLPYAAFQADEEVDYLDASLERSRVSKRRALWAALGVLVIGGGAAAGLIAWQGGGAPGAPQRDRSAEVGPSMAPLGGEQRGAAPALAGAPPAEAALAGAPPAEAAVAVTPPAPVATPVAVPVEAAQPLEAVAPAEPATGTLELRGLPADAKVYLDGELLGSGPMRVRELAAGAHQLEIRGADDTVVKALEVNVPAGDTESLRLDVAAAPAPVAAPAPAPAPEPAREPEPRKKPAAKKAAAARAAAPGAATLMINAKPSCEIFVDGKRTGLFTPQRALELPAGSHEITFVNKQYGIKSTRKIKVKAGETKKLIVDLTDAM